MALLRAQENDKAGTKVVPKVADNPAKLTPKATMSVTGRPAFASTLIFERNVAGAGTIKFSATEATLRDLVGQKFRNARGYAVTAKRRDGPLTTEVAHDFGSNLSKGKTSLKQERDGRTYTLDYTGWMQKGLNASVIDASINNKQHKLAASYNVENQLSSLTYSNTQRRVQDKAAVALVPEEWTYTAGVNSKQAVKLNAARKRGDTTVQASYIFPVVVAGEYKHKGFKVTAVAPITNEGLGEAKIVASFEKTLKF